MERCDVVIAGAGIVGIAIAKTLARVGREVLVLEAANTIGTETSSRNSEVIHAGLYYPTGSLKARFCVAGKETLYAYAADRGIPHRRCGKLVVATEPSELVALERLKAQAHANGVHDLRMLQRAEVRQLEPELRAHAALLSPSTGIIDSHALMLSMQADAEHDGAMFVFRAPVLAARAMDNEIEVYVGGAEPITLRARLFVNSAGLNAPALARRIVGLDPATIPSTYFAKGQYVRLKKGAPPFARLVYPIPVPGGLGIHYTLDIAGQVKFGPDIQWVETVDYRTDTGRVHLFENAIRRYWPALSKNNLVPDYTGIRPKIVPPGAGEQDFVIQRPAGDGIESLINLYGIESPGLTASLAIADEVLRLATQHSSAGN